MRRGAGGICNKLCNKNKQNGTKYRIKIFKMLHKITKNTCVFVLFVQNTSVFYFWRRERDAPPYKILYFGVAVMHYILYIFRICNK